MTIKRNEILEEIEGRIEDWLEKVDNPEYVTNTTPTSITIRVNDWRGTKDLVITMDDLITYYLKDARNISSGGRTLAGHFGDWRPIDNLAEFCLDYFTYINDDIFRKKALNRGLHLK